MFQRFLTGKYYSILLIGVIFLSAEFMFFNSRVFLSLIFLSFIVYMGWKYYSHVTGKIMFFIGSVSVFLTVINMNPIRILIIAVILLFVLDYRRSKSNRRQVMKNTQ